MKEIKIKIYGWSDLKSGSGTSSASQEGSW